MKLIYFFCFALLVSIGAHAQSGVEKQVDDKRKELLLAGIDRSVCYYRYANGDAPTLVIPGDTSCHTDEIKYLIWSKGEQSYIQQFDKCRQHPPIAISSSFIRTINTNYKRLVNERGLAPGYSYFRRGKKFDIIQQYSHSTFTVFEINTGDKNIRKSIDEADLGVKYLDAKHKNINYLHNLNSIQYKLIVLAEAAVKKINK